MRRLIPDTLFTRLFLLLLVTLTAMPRKLRAGKVPSNSRDSRVHGVSGVWRRLCCPGR